MRFSDTSSASSSTRFMYSSNPCRTRHVLNTLKVIPACHIHSANTYNNAAFYSELLLLEQPDLHFLPTLQESENQVLQQECCQMSCRQRRDCKGASRSRTSKLELTIGWVMILLTFVGIVGGIVKLRARLVLQKPEELKTASKGRDSGVCTASD